MYYKPLASCANYFKRSKEGISVMSSALEEFVSMREQKAEKRGEEKATEKFVSSLLASKKFSLEEIAGLVHVPLEEVQRLKATQPS